MPDSFSLSSADKGSYPTFSLIIKAQFQTVVNNIKNTLPTMPDWIENRLFFDTVEHKTRLNYNSRQIILIGLERSNLS